MNTTARNFDQMMQDDAWQGFGYLGGRQQALAEQPAMVFAVDALVMAATAAWTDEERFAWANSRSGRYAADILFGGSNSVEAILFGNAETAEQRFARVLHHGLIHKVAL